MCRDIKTPSPTKITSPQQYDHQSGKGKPSLRSNGSAPTIDGNSTRNSSEEKAPIYAVVDDILAGKDIRTTIMIRKYPFKVYPANGPF